MRRSQLRRAAAAIIWCTSAVALAQGQSVGHIPRTPWGDPDLQGVFSNENDVRVPLERPDRFAGRSLESITTRELEELARELNESGRRNPGAQAFGGLSPQRFDLTPTRAWLLVDPPDGKMPPLTPLGQQRSRTYAERNARTPASAADANLWYRCISIGLPRSMMPMVDGAPYRIVQSPGYVVIQYEIMHEARVIPLGGQPHVGSAIATYMGDARGHWEGDTLVVDTTNFKGEFQVTRAAGKDLHIVERFTPTGGDLAWSVTIDDPSGWTRPWTLSMPLARIAERAGPLENACHEGNYTLRHILSAARSEEESSSR